MTKLLIVEDNSRARRALKALISQQSEVQVTAEAANGREAIQTINGQIPDLVLMDVRMPVMNGLDATRVIKSKWPQVKVVILSMYPDYQPEAMQAGADAFLVKGSPVEELTALFRALQRPESALHGGPARSG